MELAIDTSTRYASIALARQGQVVWEESWRSEQNHTVELMPAVEGLLKKAHASVKDLTGIAVAQGPGQFSALRVGLSLAKGLAAGLGVPIVGVNTLLLEAFPYLSLGMPVYALLDAGRGDVAWAPFVDGQGTLQDPSFRVTDLEALLQQATPPALLCGEGVSQWLEKLMEHRQTGVLVAKATPPTRRAGVLASLGSRRLLQGQADDLATLQPIYLRGPSISAPKAAS
ncbi:MAG: tRNA (adenosine(37)-N6)-threonylcarbamoyltransferase complex dimerization subunit type 1 TsaB [Dehalococcoidia bacterium]|nr:tRNA (adenosine(37)-N6)-threonylcarbamoyltransferase complex dimerization subunit type 1 TsaB [Dehalococcoidia bacterium]